MRGVCVASGYFVRMCNLIMKLRADVALSVYGVVKIVCL